MKYDTKYLTSIRGLACLIVLTAHILASIPNVGYNVSGCGKIGVWLFFILSAFLLTYQWNEKGTITKKELLKFYIKRIFRIFPCYIITLIISFLIGYIGDIKTFIRHIFLLEGIGHFWTIPVEFIYYIISPFIMLVLLKLKNKKISIILLSITLLFFCIVFPYGKCPENSTNLCWYLPVFIMGMLMPYIYKYFENKTISHIGFDLSTCIIVLAMICTIPYVRNLIFHIAPNNYLQNKYLYFGIAWSIILISIQNSKYLKTFFNNSKVLLWVGNISFPLYLIHYIVINNLHIENLVVKVFAIISVSLGLSILMHQFIEVPMIKLSRKINKKIDGVKNEEKKNQNITYNDYSHHK